jgi:hypothetical protein
MAEDSRGDRPHGPAPATDSGHETSDVSIGGIVKFGIGLAVATVVTYLAVWGVFRLLQARERKEDRPVPPMVAASLHRTPREPRLEPVPLAPRRQLIAREDAVLTTYRWVDRGTGLVRIPIDRAMDLLVERGLPPSKPVTPAALATPRPTPPVTR